MLTGERRIFAVDPAHAMPRILGSWPAGQVLVVPPAILRTPGELMIAAIASSFADPVNAHTQALDRGYVIVTFGAAYAPGEPRYGAALMSLLPNDHDLSATEMAEARVVFDSLLPRLSGLSRNWAMAAALGRGDIRYFATLTNLLLQPNAVSEFLKWEILAAMHAAPITLAQQNDAAKLFNSADPAVNDSGESLLRDLADQDPSAMLPLARLLNGADKDEAWRTALSFCSVLGLDREKPCGEWEKPANYPLLRERIQAWSQQHGVPAPQ